MRRNYLFALLLSFGIAYAQRYNDIKVYGAEGLGKQAVMHYSKLDLKQDITSADIRLAVINLYKSGLFEDVKVYASGKDLVIKVVEKPVLSKINFTGTEHMPREQFIKALASQGIEVGKIYNAKATYQIKPMLEQTLAAMGYEDSVVTVDSVQKRKSMVLNVSVKEGKEVLIKDVSFVGVKNVSDRVLSRVMDSSPRLWSLLTGNNKFSNALIQKDLQAIVKYYQSKGYVEARAFILKKKPVDGGIGLVIKVVEGKKYTVSGVTLDGFAKSDYSKTTAMLPIGEAYDVEMVEHVRVELEHDLGSLGYAFAQVSFEPKLMSGNKVAVAYSAVLGEKANIRRINFTGQSYTQDEVLRREMRQMEVSQYNYSQVRESERRLRNLEFIKDVKCTPIKADGGVDLNCNVTEMNSAQFVASVGYSPQLGVTYKLDFNQKNLAGSGKRLQVSLEKSDVQTSGLISMTQPYIFGSNFSNTWSFDAVKLKNVNKDASNYQTNHVGVYNDFAMPITNRGLFSLGLGLQKIKIVSYDKTVNYVNDFVNSHGKQFSVLDAHFALSHNSYDRTPFPTSGSLSKLIYTITLPYQDNTLRYYKVDFNNSTYIPLRHGLVFNWLVQLGYGQGYGGDNYPFFKNYWAGGEGSVRGFDTNSLGPQDNKKKPMGGNVLVASSANLYFPQKLGDDIRYGLFVDTGNVFNDSFNASEMRVSTGAVLQWRTPLAPMSFALGFPVVKKQGDKLQSFSVSISTDF